MKDSIRRQLEKTVERFEEVGALLADPEVIGKPGRFKDLSVEYSRLEPVATRFREFGRLEAERVTAAEMAGGADAEMREMAEEEMRDLDTRIEAEAAARDIRKVQVETLSFQAIGFYLKQGYEIFAQLDDKPPGHTWYYLKKELG
jgi:protein subunit release factor A